MNALRGITGKIYSYSDEDHLLTAGDTTYEYDKDGFLTQKFRGAEVTKYDYSLRGELLKVGLPDGKVIEYIHDPLGRRIAKKVNGIVVEKYLWQGLTRLLAVYDGADDLLMRFEYADDRMPLVMTKAGVTYYLSYDQVGSLRVVADNAGNVVKKIDYDSFGNIIADSNEGFAVPFGFAGGPHDRDTGLVKFGYRDYDPEVGRWTAKDPILFAGGDTDLYGYVLNDPINWVDPWGFFRAPPFGDPIGYDIDLGGPGSWDSSSVPPSSSSFPFPLFADKRTEAEKEAARQAYYKDLAKRLSGIWGLTKIVTYPEKAILWAPFHTVDKLKGQYPEDSYLDPWHHHYERKEETNPCE